jgi:hypothetical protein
MQGSDWPTHVITTPKPLPTVNFSFKKHMLKTRVNKLWEQRRSGVGEEKFDAQQAVTAMCEGAQGKTKYGCGGGGLPRGISNTHDIPLHKTWAAKASKGRVKRRRAVPLPRRGA